MIGITFLDVKISGKNSVGRLLECNTSVDISAIIVFAFLEGIEILKHRLQSCSPTCRSGRAAAFQLWIMVPSKTYLQTWIMDNSKPIMVDYGNNYSPKCICNACAGSSSPGLVRKGMDNKMASMQEKFKRKREKAKERTAKWKQHQLEWIAWSVIMVQFHTMFYSLLLVSFVSLYIRILL